MAVARYVKCRPLDKWSGGRQIISGGHQIKYVSYLAPSGFRKLLYILFIYFISLIVFLPIEYYLGFYKILISIVIFKQMGLWCGVRPYTLLNPALTTPLLCPSSNKTGTYKQDWWRLGNSANFFPFRKILAKYMNNSYTMK